MQRPASIRTSDEYINIPQIHVKRSPGNKKTPDNSDDELPLYDLPSCSCSGGSKKEISRPRSSISEKWVHVIPVILFICALILWWFSHPVDVVIKDGRIIAVKQIVEQLNNNTQGNQTVSSSDTQSENFVRKEMEVKKYVVIKDGEVIAVKQMVEQRNNNTQGNQTASSSATQPEKFVRKEMEVKKYVELKHITNKAK